MTRRGWQFWIDRGGTFTDVIGWSPEGELHVRKVLSSQSGTDGCDPGLRAARELAAGDRIEALKVGTTVATNALLTRQGAQVAWVTTEGFADALRIGYQNRPDIFARRIVLPEPLHAEVIEARERIDAHGEVLIPLDEERLEQDLQRLRAAGISAVAIVLMHGWRHAAHESRAAAIARRLGFEEVSVSHELTPLARFVARGDTTVLNAYLSPPLARYLHRLQQELASGDPQARLELMQSNGGLADPARFHAMAAVLSGPAGGLIGMEWCGRQINQRRLIGFDMGGTSTDISLLDGEIPRRYEHQIAGVRLQQAMLDVHTIAAGGGSILGCADGRLQVGPDSAGALPGPACYGRQGPATLTDVQVVLGRLRPDTLPHVFGAEGRDPIEPRAAELRLDALAASARLGGAGCESIESLAARFLDVAVEAMANAIRRVATRAGLDAADFALFCFGGAAGQHACRVADSVGMRTVIVHPLASVLSALGIGVADRLAVRRSSVQAALAEPALAMAAARLAELEEQACSELAACGAERAQLHITHTLELRSGESESTIDAPMGSLSGVRERFERGHRERFGFAAAAMQVVIEAVRVEARLPSLGAGVLRMPRGDASPDMPRAARVWFEEWLEVPVLAIEQLSGTQSGPALLVEPHSTVVLEPGWSASRLAGGELMLERAPVRAALREPRAAAAAPPDPGRIEIFDNLFMHIAEQMGEVLKSTAQSVNIRERLDYSCALFDASGGLVANAPHMPVHLGSMGASVRAVLAAHGEHLRPGDAWLLNSPYHGGTHLPDMTVVSPVFLTAVQGAGTARPDFFVASRAHHADIGGSTPGSMPPFSRHIDEEGALFESFQLVAAGELREAQLRAALCAGLYPARRPEQNLADLRAQLAANARGSAELARAVGRFGGATVSAYMRHVQENAAECVRSAIARLRPGAFSYEMDSGQCINVRIDIDSNARRARIDFTGTSAQQPNNFNAPRAVCVAAVLYVFRTLVERPIPLNEGCLEPLSIVIPRGSLLDPDYPAAVAAGNVETSQCIVDALYGALGVLAASQGTMNNLTFGDAQLQYYETIAGGAGAGPDFAGCAAVQTHMTNSRLTDPEILEMRFPVLLRHFRIRRGSGGAGRFRGGDGVSRSLQFRARLHGALLANHRRIAPFGLAGGAPGATGAASVRRVSGVIEPLGAAAAFEAFPGDELTILTPGGGGFGPEDG